MDTSWFALAPQGAVGYRPEERSEQCRKSVQQRRFRRGEWSWLASPEGTLAYERDAAGDRRAVIINFTDEAVRAPLEESWRVEVASDGVGEGEPVTGSVAPSAGLLLAPEGSSIS